MTSPDANTWLVILFNCCAYVIMWFKKDKRAAKNNALILDQHRRMYADYKVLHNIKENGEVIRG